MLRRWELPCLFFKVINSFMDRVSRDSRLIRSTAFVTSFTRDADRQQKVRRLIAFAPSAEEAGSPRNSVNLQLRKGWPFCKTTTSLGNQSEWIQLESTPVLLRSVIAIHRPWRSAVHQRTSGLFTSIAHQIYRPMSSIRSL